jgi:outer membrane cobalamin receptor
VVTASRRPARARDALSLGSVGRDAIVLTGATHHAEVLNRVAGVMIQRGSGQESLTAIRSPVLPGAGSCGAFLFLENGIPIRPVGFCNVNELFEINTEQAHAIEVLRGPGTALYGSNAMHGTVNVLQAAMTPARAVGVEAARRITAARLPAGSTRTRDYGSQRSTPTTTAGVTTPATTGQAERLAAGRWAIRGASGLAATTRPGHGGVHYR